MATVRKSDIAERVAEKLDATNAGGERALNAVLDSVMEALANGDRVVLTGFGAFETRTVGERQVRAIKGRNAGNLVTVPSHSRIAFKPGAQASAAIGK